MLLNTNRSPSILGRKLHRVFAIVCHGWIQNCGGRGVGGGGKSTILEKWCTEERYIRSENSFFFSNFLIKCYQILTLEASKKKYNTIHPIDLKFGTYNKLHLYFQLSKPTWCLIGFHGNNSQINDVTGGRDLGFSNFQILFKFSLSTSD